MVKLEADFFSRTEFQDNVVTAWAGADLTTLVLTSVKKGLAGIEMLTGIPGSVGGAVRMNTGGSFGDIGSVVESVSLMDGKGQVFEKSKPELSFDYRSSNITAKLVLNAKIVKNREDRPFVEDFCSWGGFLVIILSVSSSLLGSDPDNLEFLTLLTLFLLLV